jgi:osmotically-inducible protein OsmY
MADRTYRSGRDRYERGYGRQAEQFDAADYDWRDDERSYGQMEGWHDDYGQFDTSGQSYSRDRQARRDWGRDPSYSRRAESRPAARFERNLDRSFSYGAGSQLAANHGEWRDSFDGPNPSTENRDYRDTWGGIGRDRYRNRNERGFLERAGDTLAQWFGDDGDYGRSDRGYRGKGPANYTRSDERIRDDANDRLTDDWHVDASRIEVIVENGEITLNGTVPSREQKRRAEDCVDGLSGVRNVQNNLRVEQNAAWNRDEDLSRSDNVR